MAEWWVYGGPTLSLPTAMNPPSYEGAAPSYEDSALHILGPTATSITSGPGERGALEVLLRYQESQQEALGDTRRAWRSTARQDDPNRRVGSNLTGSVSLALQTKETIQAVVVSVKEEIIRIKWRRTCSPNSNIETKTHIMVGCRRRPSNSKKKSGKLKGEYTWPFSIHIPNDILCQKRASQFELPHTFFERALNSSIQYSVELRIMRGKLRQDDKRVCTLGVFSMRQPGPPSMLRTTCVPREQSSAGPRCGSGGWKSLLSFSISGLLYSVLEVDVKCTITNGVSRRDANPLVCGQAVFWASTEGAAAETSLRRQLMGEIHLRPTLQPSTDVVDFLIEYTVLVFPFQATGFKPPRYAPLHRQKVDIVTRYASGARARTYTPATYETRNAVINEYYIKTTDLDTRTFEGLVSTFYGQFCLNSSRPSRLNSELAWRVFLGMIRKTNLTCTEGALV
ncbi:hypothetical protein C8J57DRAFT_1477043 [Mycena rebaudengoi]|nr:hypothetical protein C8J57DRAFT_1477043 [Mycena rebaudengoi]